MEQNEKRYVTVTDENTKEVFLIRIAEPMELAQIFVSVAHRAGTSDDKMLQILTMLSGELLYRRAMHGELPVDPEAQKMIANIKARQAATHN